MLTYALIAYGVLATLFVLGLCKAAARGDAMADDAMLQNNEGAHDPQNVPAE
jgi:hypothetical protein